MPTQSIVTHEVVLCDLFPCTKEESDCMATNIITEQLLVEGECEGFIGNSSNNRSQMERAQSLIMSYSFDKVRYRLQKEGKISDIERAIAEFRKFLIICLLSQKPVGMVSPVIDEVWHAFILFTREYASFTTEVFGEFLHHTPNTPFSPASSGSAQAFLSLYKEVFGELDPIWVSREETMCIIDPGDCWGGDDGYR